MSRPIPGMEKTFSTMILPPRISAAVIPKIVMTGIKEFLTTWRYMTFRLPNPLL